MSTSTAEWEIVTRDQLACTRTTRLRVPGGWLYRSEGSLSPGGDALAVALAFVPEPRTSTKLFDAGDGNGPRRAKSDALK
jgi:hypothetical protein